MKKEAWASIPPKSNRSDLYRARNQVEWFFNRIKQCRRCGDATTGSRETTSPLSNSHLFGYGSPRIVRPRPG